MTQRNFVTYIDENKYEHRAEVIRFEAEKAVIRIFALGRESDFIKTVLVETLRPLKKEGRK